jgi:outer membrane protein, heavy metal efflux system
LLSGPQMKSRSRPRNFRRIPFARHLAAALLALVAVPARAASPAPPAVPTDAALAALIEEALAGRPELRAADARVRAERERAAQADALPDPVLSLGIQNDGFGEIMIGEMETSFWQVMVSQTFPWPGKRGLRGAVADLSVRAVGADAERARLSIEAEVRRAYVDLQLARERLALLDRLESLWETSEGLARTRYEAGTGAQSDLLRAQLERTRLRQRRFALLAEERGRMQALNRLRGAPLGAQVETATSLRELPAPALRDLPDALADAEARSPELAAALLGERRADRAAALARRERFPDVTVSAGVMPRGSLEPMWQAAVSVPLPFLSRRGRAVAEGEELAAADRASAEAVGEVLRLRVAERHTTLASLLETVTLYRTGLLAQSENIIEATLSQYRVGRITFASVLEALAGYVSDEDGFLAAVADAHRLAIASLEVSLDPAGGGAVAGMGGGAMPGAGTMAGGAAGARGAAASPSSPPAMGGM